MFLQTLVAAFVIAGTSASPLLLYSKSDESASFNVALGTRLSDQQFFDQIVKPQIDKYLFVVFDIDDLSYDSLTQVADENSPSWSFLKGELGSSSFQMLLEYSGKGDAIALEGVKYFSNSGKSQDMAADSLLKIWKSEARISDDMPVIYVIRSVTTVASGNDLSPPNHVIKRRSTTDNTYIITDCYLMNWKHIQFVPLGSDWGSKAPRKEIYFAPDGNVDCNNQTARHFSLTLTAGDVTVDGTTTTTANDVTLRMNMISYLKYGDSQYYKYWYADDLMLKFTVDGDSYEYPITNGYIAAPQDKSYACQNPDIWPMQPPKTGDINKKAYDASLSFTNLQVDVNFVFNNTGPIDRNWFSDGVDCDDRLGKGGVVGLAFVFLVLLIGLYLLTLLSTAQNPVFGDKQIVVAQE